MAHLQTLEWPRHYRPLIDRYGPVTVFAAGLVALGYPPTWCDRFKSFEAVRVRLFDTYGV